MKLNINLAINFNLFICIVCFGLSALAQVSNVEGIEPINGVTIPKIPKEQIPQEKFESPYYLKIYTPSYPVESKRLGEEGVVMVRVLIGSEGEPQKAEIQTTSGFKRLDQAALNAVIRWRFMPGKRDGVVEAMWYQVPVKFSLQTSEKESQVSVDFENKSTEDFQTEQDSNEAENLRLKQLKRLKSLGATSNNLADPLTETNVYGKPSDSYLGRLRARVKPNITFSESQLQSVRGNPAADVEVIVSPSGKIIGMKLTQSSGNAAWDQAVLKAIEKTATLPLDEYGKILPKIAFAFRPRD